MQEYISVLKEASTITMGAVGNMSDQMVESLENMEIDQLIPIKSFVSALNSCGYRYLVAPICIRPIYFQAGIFSKIMAAEVENSR